ncbi:MAG: PadR family transcriptional regulator [Candidatus Omnitrophica bacterium]|nr:PadR family transcriptional regulator [Candidatus Omnitrophota bacterium]
MKLSDLEKMVVLGLLHKGNQHGYELRQVIQQHFGQLTGFRPRAIYYCLQQLERSGLVSPQKQKLGGRPERTVYSLTEAGKHEFQRLMESNLLEPFRPFFNVDLALYFLPYLPQEWLEGKLKAVERRWREVRIWARRQAKQENWPYQMIFSHLERTIEAEISFLKILLTTLTPKRN